MPRKYYLLNRPPCIGTHPKGAITMQAWMPAVQIEAGHLALGWVEYDDPLPLHQVWTYELWPADRTEQCAFYFFNHFDRNYREAEHYAREFGDYVAKLKEKPFHGIEQVAYHYFVECKVSIDDVCAMFVKESQPEQEAA